MDFRVLPSPRQSKCRSRLLVLHASIAAQGSHLPSLDVVDHQAAIVAAHSQQAGGLPGKVQAGHAGGGGSAPHRLPRVPDGPDSHPARRLCRQRLGRIPGCDDAGASLQTG